MWLEIRWNELAHMEKQQKAGNVENEILQLLKILKKINLS